MNTTTDTQRYTIEVSAAELDVIRLALGRMIDPKPVRRRRAVAAAPFEPNTGNPALDAFMRRNHKPGQRIPAVRPTHPVGLPAVGKLSDKRREAFEYEWNREIERARDSIRDHGESRAGVVLRELVALHYPQAN